MNLETSFSDRLRAGDAQAFAAVVRQYNRRMHAVARRILQHSEDSADAVQDALLAAYRFRASFKGEAALWTWLYRVLVNACLTLRRAQRRRRMLSLQDLRGNLREAGRSALAGLHKTDSASTHAEQIEVRARVRHCIERLPRRYRDVLLLRDIDQLNTEQTAQRLGTSPGAVKSRLHRARHALRLLLEPMLRLQL